MKFYMQTAIKSSFDEAEALAKEAISKSGFGLVSEIDLHEKLKASLNVDYPKYKILGACNPAYSYKTVQAEDNIGLLLPCNVLVKEKGDALTEISVVDPEVSMNMVESEVVQEVASEVKEIMEGILDYINEKAEVAVS